MRPDIQKFKWGELHNNSKGKTALSLLCAHYLMITGCICFMYSCWHKYGEGMMTSTGLIVTGAGLLGIRRFTKDKEITNDTDNKDDDDKPNS